MRLSTLYLRYSRRLRRYRWLWTPVFFLLLGIAAYRVQMAFFAVYSREVPTHGGQLIDASVGRFQSGAAYQLFPTPMEQDVQRLLHATLLRYDPSTGQVTDGLCTHRVSEDSLTHTLTLQPQARYSDGSPVTVDDILFTLEVLRHQSFPDASLRQRFQYVDVQAISDHEVRFTLPEPNALFTTSLVIPVLQRDAYAGALLEEILDPDYPANLQPLSTGPYVLKRVIPSEKGAVRVLLRANPYYYRGEPYIEQLTLYGYAEESALPDALPEAGQLSHLSSHALQLLPESTVERFQRQSYILPRWFGVFYNLDSPVTGLPSIRTALGASINRTALLPAEDYVPIRSPFFFEGISGHSDATTDPAAVLNSAGITLPERAVTREKDGVPVRLRLVTSTMPPLYQQMAAQLQETWERTLQLRVDLRVLPQSEFLTAVAQRDYDVLLYGESFTENFDVFSPWHSTQTGKLNLSNLTNNTVDQLIYQMQRTGTYNDLSVLQSTLEKLEPATIIGTPVYTTLTSPLVLGRGANGQKYRQHADRWAGVSQWYFSTEPMWDKRDQTTQRWWRIFWQWLWRGGQTAESSGA